MWPFHRRSDDDFQAEIKAHIEIEAERLMADGLPATEARRTARRRFGNVTNVRERFFESRRLTWLDDARRDVGYVVRTLRRSPGFTAAAVATLAVGIGANTAIFSVVNAVLLRPLPYHNPSSLIVVEHAPIAHTPDWAASVWRESARTLGDFAGLRLPQLGRLSTQGGPEQVNWVDVTWNLPSMLGTRPALGRGFAESDAMPGAPPVALLSHDFWTTMFAADASVVGSSVVLNGEPVTVVGVATPRFRFPVADFVLPGAPITFDTQPDIMRASAEGWFTIIGRLAPDATPASVRTELRTLFEQAGEAHFSRRLLDRMAFVVTPLQERLVGNTRHQLLLVMGTVAFVLLLACANVANLLLARASTRQREIALRRALGAREGRLVRLVLTESLVLAFVGAAFGLLLAHWAGEAAGTLLAGTAPHVEGITIDRWVLAFAIAVAVLTGLICGLAALPGPSRMRAAIRLDGATRTVGHGIRFRRALLAGEVAATFVLVVGAALLGQTLVNLDAQVTGFDADRVLTLRVSPGLELRADDSQARTAVFFDDLRLRIAQLPGVASVAATSHVPLTTPGVGSSGISVEGLPFLPDGPTTSFVPVTPDYFRTMGIDLVAGREVNESDRAPVALVNEAFLRHWGRPGGDLVGARMQLNDWKPAIVGVAADVPSRSLRDAAAPVIFVPLSQSNGLPFAWPQLTVVVRARDGLDPQALAPMVEREIWRTGPDVVVDQVATMNDRISDAMRSERVLAVMLSLFAGIAIVIAAVGVYGVVAYATARRTGEIGVRMALGASRADIARLILSETMRPAVLGVGAGIAGATLTTRLVATTLFGVTPLDTGTFAGAAVALLAITVVATSVPTHRATRIDPLDALRCE